MNYSNQNEKKTRSSINLFFYIYSSIRNPLCTNFRNPFETENQAKYKSHQISEIPQRFNKNEKVDIH